MTRKIIHDISASSVQVIINQSTGIVLFYVLSKFLTKNDFGEINWFLAVLTITFAILGFGMDQVIVRKTAAGTDPSALLQVSLFHVFFMGSVFIIFTALASLFSLLFFNKFNILAFLAIGQLLFFLAVPFKQIANGKEQFRTLLWMSASASIIKVTGIILLAWMHQISLLAFIFLYNLASAVELIACIILARKSLGLRISVAVNWPAWKALTRESLPQLGVIIFNAGIARIDWILLGIISTASVLGEYSFAYKAFEMSTVPLLILAPLLLPKFTKWFHPSQQGSIQRKKEYLFVLARMEIIFAAFGALILNIIWAPLVDAITDNKYGAVNSSTILILTCCLPFLYVNNILWSVNFAQGRMKMIFFVFAVTFAVTCAGDLLLIPFFSARGAAFAYLVAIVIQTLHFVARTHIDRIYRICYYLLFCTGSFLLSRFIAKYFAEGLVTQLVLATACYFILIGASRQFRVADWFSFRKMAWT
jgi:O-antigen/teichoic acid export membrane protein